MTNFNNLQNFIQVYKEDEVEARKLIEAVIECWRDSEDTSDLDRDFMMYFVEPLKDSFGKDEGEFYAGVFAELIVAAAGKSNKIKEWLAQIKIDSRAPEEDLVERHIALLKQKSPLSNEQTKKIRKVIILSRATIGADSLVSSLLVRRVIREFRNADVIFVDAAGIGNQLLSVPGLISVSQFIDQMEEVVSLRWNRNGFSILEGLEYSVDLYNYIKIITQGFQQYEYILLDPDSRLSQTGMMPLIHPGSHYFIDTSVTDSEKKENNIKSLGEICSSYLNHILGGYSDNYPRLEIRKNCFDDVRGIFKSLALTGKTVVTVHFGAEPESKFLSLDFEKSLILKLLELRVIPVLVRSPKESEEEKIRYHVKEIKAEGRKVTELTLIGGEYKVDGAQAADIYTFKGDIGIFAALVKRSNLYIGYDSLGQHIAAASGTPTITVFAGHINQAFLKRWTPFGEGQITIIEIDRKQSDSCLDTAFREKHDSKIVDKILDTVIQVQQGAV